MSGTDSLRDFRLGMSVVIKAQKNDWLDVGSGGVSVAVHRNCDIF